MAIPPVRFSQLRWFHNLACVIGIVGGFAVMALGVMDVRISSGRWLVVAGGFSVVIASLLMTLMPLLLKMEASLARQLSELRELNRGIEKQTDSLTRIAENTGISDAAKSLAHRSRELESLRKTIREDIANQNWETALKFIDEMEHRFGYKEEADRVREELDSARTDAIHVRLAQAIELIERHFKAHEWDRAQREIERLMNALPGNAKVASLLDRQKILRDQHKQELSAFWKEAMRRSDTDQAIEVLRELDQYLSPAEAHALQSSARHVFKDKLLQLGVQFRFAVTEKRWKDALSTGLELVRDFPNARMANEVREALGTLRERARQQSDESVVEMS